MKRVASIVLVLLLLIGNSYAREAEDLRVEYQNFLSNYSENIIFINTNTGRNLIPLIFSSGETVDELRVYQLYGDVLSATVKTKGTSRGIVWCQIKLTAPAYMSYGDSTYRDFTTSGFHSYALLMSMSRSEDPEVRYALVNEINDALAKADVYETFVGDYKLLCMRSGSTVTLSFGWHEWEPSSGLPSDEIAGDDSVEGMENDTEEDMNTVPENEYEG